MKKLKFLKIWESFVNEEFTVGNKIANNLFVIKSKLEMAERTNAYKDDKEELKKMLKSESNALQKYLFDNFDIEANVLTDTYVANQFNVVLKLPLGFFAKLGKFFGLGETRISLFYGVRDLHKLEYTETSPGVYEIPEQDLNETFSLYIGAKRENVGQNYEREIKNNQIEIKVEDAQKMVNVIKELNPATNIDIDGLIKKINTSLEESYKTFQQWAKNDTSYSFAAVNKVVLM